MQSSGHPEYETEHTHLRKALVVVDAEAKRVHDTLYNPPALDAWDRDDNALAVHRQVYPQYLTELREMQAKPYFGRLVFLVDGEAKPTSHYIGDYRLKRDGVEILGWQSPVAALFYRQRTHDVSYETAQGRVKGKLQLRRRLTIADRKLDEIRDEVDLRETAEQLAIAIKEADVGSAVPALPQIALFSQDPDEYLREVLSSAASPKLKQIAASLQADQYALIEAPADESLIVQGVAGSGKSSVALHRLSYLLYPGNAQHIAAERCVIFGPNELFLKYTEAVLPRLSIGGIRQTTLEAFAKKNIEQAVYDAQKEANRHRSRPRTETVALTIVDAALDAMLDARRPIEQARKEYHLSRLKTSQPMARLLDRYLAHLRADVRLPAEGLLFDQIGLHNLGFRLPEATMREGLAKYQTRPLDEHRRMFIDWCVTRAQDLYDDALLLAYEKWSAVGRQQLHEAEQLEREVKRTLGVPLAPADEQRLRRVAELRAEGQRLVDSADARFGAATTDAQQRRVRTSLQEMVERRIARFWTPFDVLDSYDALYAEPGLLDKLGADIFTSNQLQRLKSYNRSPRRHTVDQSDLRAMHYLAMAALPATSLRFDHVIIDEAQDVSELEFLTLRRFFAPRAAFTIVGDLAQGIYSYHGVDTWERIAAILGAEQTHIHELVRGFRNSYEIMTTANVVLQGLREHRASIALAEPFERHGATVTLQQVRDDSALLSDIRFALADMDKAHHRNVAIITKTSQRCEKLAWQLKNQVGVPLDYVRTDKFDYKGGVVVIPVHLAKGVEFDAAIVVDADAATYSESELDGRLLYVALTRPLHQLCILWQGQRTAYLDGAQGKQLR